jgi:hypothetical protein
MKSPNQRQQIPLTIAGLLAFAIVYRAAFASDFLASVIRQLTTPGSLVLFPILILWYCFVRSEPDP